MSAGDVTLLLGQVKHQGREAADELFPLVYEELKGLALARLRGERPDHTLNATALVHEAYLKLVDQTRTDWRDRAHFFAIAARAMRRLLIDHARARMAGKRGGGTAMVTLDEASEPGTRRPEELIALDDALQTLAEMDPRQARVVEYRFFVGLRDREIAEVLGISIPTVQRDWRSARAWLRTQLAG